LFAGLQVAAVLTIVLGALSMFLVVMLPAFGLHPDVLVLIKPYLWRLLWSTPPLLAYAVFRRYLQAMHVVRPVMYALLLANLVNLAGNWVLIYGHLGFRAMGVNGSAWATVLSRIALAAFLLGVIVRRERATPSGLHDVPFVWDSARNWRIVRVGLPAAGQIVLEVGIFAAASALAGRIAPAALAAHQIVLNIASFIFMAPLGFSTAAAVRVGHAVGRGDSRGARAAGWAALVLTTMLMMASATLLALAPRWLMTLFTRDPDVIHIGIGLLIVAAVFQLFDGMQAVSTGALRGLGNTHTPMVVNLIGHWLMGLPIAYFLCFSRGLGAQGLWMGLAAGLMVTGAVLLGVWNRQSRAIGPRAF
ncbi:MAG TPA: MATE family efflux transporter, partial [Vicinamibacterales bacterium]|nr:MATE family efflux transporter [Vicinamibacterales bacterium]